MTEVIPYLQKSPMTIVKSKYNFGATVKHDYIYES